jgi:hypothetical protein
VLFRGCTPPAGLKFGGGGVALRGDLPAGGAENEGRDGAVEHDRADLRPPLTDGAAHRWPWLIPPGHHDREGAHEIGAGELAQHGDRLALDPTLLPTDLDMALGPDAGADDALDRALRDAEPQEPWKLERDLPKRALITTSGSCASYPASQGLATFRRGCGTGAHAARRGRMSAKGGYCSWSRSMRLVISSRNYPIGAVTPTGA